MSRRLETMDAEHMAFTIETIPNTQSLVALTIESLDGNGIVIEGHKGELMDFAYRVRRMIEELTA